MKTIVTYSYYLSLAIGLAGLLLSPILYLVRWDVASLAEKLINTIASFLFGLFTLGVIYVGSRIGLRMEHDLQARQARLEKLHLGYRKLSLVYVPIMLLIIAAHIWFLMNG
jgi:hypothetical protein